MEIGLSLGSNLGDRIAHLSRAKREIAAWPRTKIIAQSPVYATEPVDVSPEFRHLKFLNAVLIIKTPAALAGFQRDLAALELKLGRRRGGDRFVPRTIDIDILYADDVMMETVGLTLPHPRWARRRFVVQPLADVRPGLTLPGTRRTVQEILAALPAVKAVSLFARDW